VIGVGSRLPFGLDYLATPAASRPFAHSPFRRIAVSPYCRLAHSFS
jgi:hypothetical protein